MADEAKQREALDLWEEGQHHHLKGDLPRAIELYDKSIATCPTAEAHTFRGWAYSAQGRIDDAIAECKRAIEIDPQFGNPYNDIGSYLLRQGHADEAIGWLERAKKAERYGPRHFPYMNLGRIYASQGMIRAAIAEFEGALELCPDEPVCTQALEQLQNALN
jgi:tetratricopeptide (TPR) repeat protein